MFIIAFFFEIKTFFNFSVLNMKTRLDSFFFLPCRVCPLHTFHSFCIKRKKHLGKNFIDEIHKVLLEHVRYVVRSIITPLPIISGVLFDIGGGGSGTSNASRSIAIVI